MKGCTILIPSDKIIDKRLSKFGVQYKYELELLWLDAHLVEKAEMGRIRIQSYCQTFVVRPRDPVFSKAIEEGNKGEAILSLRVCGPNICLVREVANVGAGVPELDPCLAGGA